MTCDECGCSNVRHEEVEGFGVVACQLCGHLHGNLDDLARIEEIREGTERGYDKRIYPLVKTVAMITGFKVIAANAGMVPQRTPPFIHFKIHGPKARVWLGKFLTSLTMANRKLEQRWIVEAGIVDGLTFTLKPQLDRPLTSLEGDDIEQLRNEIDRLTALIRRDMNLSWWHELEGWGDDDD